MKRTPTRIQNLNSRTWILVSSISKYSCHRVYKIDCEFGKWFQWQKFRKYYEDLNVGLNGSYWFSEGKLCSHANGFGVAGIFPADFVSCIIFYTQSHVLCIEMSLATQTQGRQCFHGYVSMIKFSTRLLFHTTTHKVSKQFTRNSRSLLKILCHYFNSNICSSAC